MLKVLWLLAATIVGLIIANNLNDPDIWWHLVIGDWMLENRTITLHERWNRFALGNPWVSYSWLPELLIAGAYRLKSEQGVLLLQMLLGIFTATTLSFIFGFLAQNYFFGLFLGTTVSVSLMSFFSLRPQVLAWLGFAIIFAALEAYRQRRISLSLTSLTIFCTIFIWCNSHLTVVFGVGLVTFYALILGECRQISLGKWLPQVSDKLLLISVALYTTLLTPSGGAHWLNFIRKVNHPFIHSRIKEFFPANIKEPGVGILAILIFMLGLSIFYKRDRLNPLLYLIPAGTVLGGLVVIKFIPFATICVAVMIAIVWGLSEDGQDFGNMRTAIAKFDHLMGAYYGSGLAILLSCLIIVTGNKILAKPFGEWIAQEREVYAQFPDLPRPIVTGFGSGGHLMFNLLKRYGQAGVRVAIDGRTNVNKPEIALSHMDALDLKPRWEDFITMTEAQTIIWNRPLPLSQALTLQPDKWQDLNPENPHIAVFTRK